MKIYTRHFINCFTNKIDKISTKKKDNANYLFSEFDSIILDLFINETKIPNEFIRILIPHVKREIIDLIKLPIVYLFNYYNDTFKLNFQLVIEKYTIRKIFSDLFNQYPELDSIFSNSFKNYLLYFDELYERYNNDKQEMQSNLHFQNKIIDIEWPLGDFHNNQSTNCLILFEENHKLIYKPKSVQNSEFLEYFIRNIELNEISFEFKTLNRIAKTNYYWEEFIDNKEMDNYNDAESFYFNLGVNLGIFYILGINDITNDNLISFGEIPVFIDLECMLTPTRNQTQKNQFPKLYQYYFESVLATGVLPFWTPLNRDEVMNIGGVNKGEDKFTNIRILDVINSNLCFTETIEENTVKHLPKFNNKYIPIRKFSAEFYRGYSEFMSYVIKNKFELISLIKNYSKIEEIKCRILLRHTSIYETIQNEARHPNNLQNKESLKEKYNLLMTSYDEISFPMKIIKDEIKQLKKNDIPIYYTTPNSLSLIGEKSYDGLIKETGIESACRKIENLNEEELKIQLRLIEDSLICFDEVDYRLSNLLVEKSELSQGCSINTFNSYFTNESEKISNYILDKSFNFDETINWLEISVGRSGNWELMPKLPGFYDGLDGIGLFFLYLYNATGNEKYNSLANSISIKTMNNFKSIDLSENFHLVSPYSYPLSAVYFYWHLSHYNKIDNKTKLNYIVNNHLLQFVKSNIEQDKYLDIVNGSAGLLVLLCDLYNYLGNEKLKILAELVFLHIKDKSTYFDYGVSWEANRFKFLIGFAHGNSGIMFALSKYYKLTKSKECLNLIEQAHNYNQKYFKKDIYNWPDLRMGADTFSKPSWCHGVLGIINSYLEINMNIGYDLITIDYKRLFENVLPDSFHDEDNICHGNIGNAVLLNKIMLNSNFTQESKTKINEYITKQITKNSSWNVGNVLQQKGGIGLFLGFAGIGYNLLKYSNNNSFPDIFILEGPK